LDGTFTMIRRLLKGEKIWEAHRSHLYQRLVIAGMKHNQVVMLVIGLYGLLLGSFFYLHSSNSQIISWSIISIATILFIFYVLICTFFEKRALTK